MTTRCIVEAPKLRDESRRACQRYSELAFIRPAAKTVESEALQAVYDDRPHVAAAPILVVRDLEPIGAAMQS